VSFAVRCELVVARATGEERAAVSTLRSLQVPIRGGRTVPLSQFVSFESGEEYRLCGAVTRSALT
jgi:hypothetical protein